MEKSKDYDWYTGIVSSAIKFIENEEQNEERPIKADACIYDVVIVPEEKIKNQFRKLYRRYPKIIPRREILTVGLAAGLRQCSQAEVMLENKMYRVMLSDAKSSTFASIPEEQLDEVISTQLAAVIEDSILEFQEQRNRFDSETKKSHDEFHRKFLQLTGKPGGDSQ